jgi:PAS domain S-box-containing protein
VEQRFYNRMLLRLLGLPVVALAILAILLGFGLQNVDQSARSVDHSDQIIAQSELVLKLIIDEETGLRGFLLTNDRQFLEPLQKADQTLGAQFDALAKMIRRRPAQVAALRQIQLAHQQWQLEAIREINDPAPPSQMETQLLDRKKSMDDIRAKMTAFVQTEHQVRDQRASSFGRLSSKSEIEFGLLILLMAIAIAWITQRCFVSIATVHRRQLEDIRLASQESYAREQWLNTTLRSIGEAVIACDVNGCVSFMNPVAEQLTGWDEASAKGHPLPDIFPIFNEATRAVVENPVDKVRRLGTIVGLANHTFLVSKNGSEICIDDSGAPIRNSSGDMIGVVLVFRDITDRKLSDDALMRAEKLAAAGRLAASVAHEVNNPLEGLTNLVYIARQTDELEEVRTLLIQAEEELGRIAHITRQSLGFYREITSATLYNPSDIIRDVSEFYRPRAQSQGIRLAILSEVATEIIGIPGEIRQVLSNLLANSIDASSTGSNSGSQIRLHAKSAFDPRNPSRPGVRISIADNGSGITSKHLEEVFEPFFTTKKDTGTGLGLWVSRQLVEKNGGSLHVRSCTSGAHRGTTFSMFLPASGKLHETIEAHLNPTPEAEPVQTN